MIIKTAKFVVSNTDVNLCPPPNLPEYAFIGRSNVGKSSLINMLVNNKNLAKTSGKPGKTRLINHFVINDDWYLVDLPGYGFAKASKEHRYKWGLFIEQYLLKRENLFNIFILLDSRHDLQKIDLEFMIWCAENSLPFSMVFTKTDKLTKSTLNKNLANYRNQMLEYWEELPPFFVTSSVSAEGRIEILDYIDTINKKNV